jgi:hypothetical protein
MTEAPRTPARFPIAESISRLLERDLGQGVDARRMLNDPLFARDVLLVCDAQPGSELERLARKFRQAPAFRMRDPAPSTHSGAPSTGFGASRPGVPSELPGLAAGGTGRKPWYSPARWIGR